MVTRKPLLTYMACVLFLLAGLLQSSSKQTIAYRPNPACCLFLRSPKAKNGFYIFKWLGGKKSKECIISYYVKFKCQCPIKFYQNTVIPTHLHAVYSCFSATTAQLSSRQRDRLAYTKIYHAALYKEHLPTLATEDEKE